MLNIAVFFFIIFVVDGSSVRSGFEFGRGIVSNYSETKRSKSWLNRTSEQTWIVKHGTPYLGEPTEFLFGRGSFFLAPYHEIFSLGWSAYNGYVTEPAPKISVAWTWLMSRHDATYVSWKCSCTSLAKLTCAQEMSFFAAQPPQPHSPDLYWFVADSDSMESHIVATALVCWKHVSGSFGHPGECHRSSCPEAFPLLYFEGALLYCSSHMGQFISLNMFEHSGVGWGRQVGSSRCNLSNTTRTKSPSLPPSTNKRTARWPPTGFRPVLHAIAVQAAMAVHGAHQWQCSNSTHRRAVAIT